MNTPTEFNEARFRELCAQAGCDNDTIATKLTRMAREASEADAKMALPMLNARLQGHRSSYELMQEIFVASADFTTFAARMASETACMADYYAPFWRILEQLRKATEDVSACKVDGGRDAAKSLSDAGVHAIQQGNVALAIERWTQAAQADPTWSVPSFNIAKCLLSSGRASEAIPHLESAVRIASRRQSSEDSQVLDQAARLQTQVMNAR